MAPRFTVNRITGEVTCHKPITGQDLFRVQRAILIKQIELHPEVFNEDAAKNKGGQLSNVTNL